MPVASASAQTRFGISGWGTRRAGSFSGKSAIVTGNFNHEVVVSSLADYLDTNLSVVTSVSYYGELIDTTQTEWAEVHVSNFSIVKKRSSSNDKDIRRGSIKVTLFTKSLTDSYRIFKLLKDFKDNLRNTHFALKDFNNGSVEVGGMRVFSPTYKSEDRGIGTRHNVLVRSVTITFPAIAQET